MTESFASPAWWIGALDSIRQERAAGTRPYLEFLRSSSLSAGIYVLAEEGLDLQKPHAQDELYLVWKGEAVLEVAGQRCPVGPGTVAFVAADVPHRFLDIRSELTVLVFFAPPEVEAG